MSEQDRRGDEVVTAGGILFEVIEVGDSIANLKSRRTCASRSALSGYLAGAEGTLKGA
jgi:preprotein translocase subunit YajC